MDSPLSSSLLIPASPILEEPTGEVTKPCCCSLCPGEPETDPPRNIVLALSVRVPKVK